MPVSVIDPFGAAHDQAMPSLILAIDPIEAKRQIKRLMRDHVAGDDRIRLRAIRVVRHKPGKRCLVEYDLKITGPTRSLQTITLIGKVRGGRFGMADYRLHRAIWQSGLDGQSSDGISIPQPIGVAPQLRMWFQRKVEGAAATDLLAGPAGESLVRRVANAAHKLHQAAIPTSRKHAIADELHILRQCLDAVLLREPLWHSRIDRIWHACLRLARTTPQAAPTGIHRDFYADQVIVSEQRLYLVDFDLYCYGDPALDIGNFIGHIIEQSLRTLGDSTRLSHVEHAMEGRFVELAGESTRHAVRTYTTLTLVRHIYLSMRFPERRHLTERLIELCEQRLGLVSDQPTVLVQGLSTR